MKSKDVLRILELVGNDKDKAQEICDMIENAPANNTFPHITMPGTTTVHANGFTGKVVYLNSLEPINCTLNAMNVDRTILK